MSVIKEIFPLIGNFLSAVVLIFAMAFSTGSLAAPVDGSVRYGDVNITYGKSVTRVIQRSQNAVILWKSFNLAKGERLEIIQPSKNARLINRVSRRGISSIEGNIKSNGQVIILNADGVNHRNSAVAQVGGMTLAGMDLSSLDAAGNTMRLSNTDPARAGGVTNRGTIKTATSGNAVLLGKRVLNQGLIASEHGSVSLAVGRSADLLFEGNGLINLNILTQEPKIIGARNPALRNVGEIIAPGGRVFLTGSRSSRVFKLTDPKSGSNASDSEIALTSGAKFNFGAGTDVANYGRLDVSGSFQEADPTLRAGRIVIIGDTVENYGRIAADALQFSNNGSPPSKIVAGQIVIAATQLVSISVDSSLSVNAMGFERNGFIKILGKAIELEGSLGAGGGGAIQIGGKGTSAPTQLTDTSNAIVDASLFGEESFNTAKFGVWASEEVQISGEIYAQSPFGSEIEIVSGNRLRFDAEVYASGSFDERGVLLLQARDILVSYKNEPWGVNIFDLTKALNYAKVTVKADGDLTVLGYPSPLVLRNSSIYSAPPASLSLLAGNDLHLQNVILSRIGELNLGAGNDMHISNSAASTSPSSESCYISAGRNVYLSNSIFYNSNWCGSTMPEVIEAGGNLQISDTLFYK